MKTFLYRGRKAGQTMTICELKKKLEEYPEDMPVFTEWEGCRAYVEPEQFEVKSVRIWDDECIGLVIDVNLY